jgi:hypothetical protein
MPEDAQGSGEVQKPEKDRKKLSANRNFMGDKQHIINPHINRFRRYNTHSIPGNGKGGAHSTHPFAGTYPGGT